MRRGPNHCQRPRADAPYEVSTVRPFDERLVASRGDPTLSVIRLSGHRGAVVRLQRRPRAAYYPQNRDPTRVNPLYVYLTGPRVVHPRAAPRSDPLGRPAPQVLIK